MNNNKKTNWYTQGQRIAARVLFIVIVGLLGSGLGNVLAAPGPVAEGGGNNDDFQKLLALANNPDWKVRQAAVETLGECCFKQETTDTKLDKISKVLIEASTAPDTHSTGEQAWQVRKEAVEALGGLAELENLGDKRDEVLTLLQKVATEDENEDVRQEAVQALWRLAAFDKLGDKRDEVLTLLQKVATEDENEDVRQAAVKALSNLAAQLQDKERKEVLDALQEVADKDEDEDVRKAAERAIAKFKEEPSAS